MTHIYHITHHDNLESMIAQAELCCDKRKAALGLTPVGIAHDSIKEQRSATRVPLAPYGTLDDYVPFYFAPRSPMLYSIHGGWVDGYKGGQRCVVHLVSSCEAVAAASLPFVFTDGHAIMAFSHFYHSLDDLAKIDWTVMPLTYWRDTQAQPDRKRKRQAEFLVHTTFPWQLVREIGVYSDAVKEVVDGIVQKADHRPNVVVRRDWYYGTS